MLITSGYKAKEPVGLPPIGGPKALGRLYIVKFSLNPGFCLGSCGNGYSAPVTKPKAAE